MKISIKNVKVKKRLRGAAGDITQLKESIQAIGLINPIILNENNELISGYRRYEACRQLGFEEIEARVMDIAENKVQQLDIEYHENIGRVDLTSTEINSYAEKRDEFLQPESREDKIWQWLKQLWQRVRALFTRKKVQ